MEEFLIKHIYFYLPFGVSFLALYLKVMGTIYDFNIRKIGQVTSRLLFTVFFGNLTYSINIGTDRWFWTMASAIILLFLDEIIAHISLRFERKEMDRTIDDCMKLLEEEFKKQGVGVIHGK